MNTIINLAKIHANYLYHRKTFAYSLIILVAICFFIIPNKDSTYATFYIGKYTGEVNDVWVGSLGSIFTNLILSFVGFFFLEGSYKNKRDSGFGNLIRVTSSSNRIVLSHQWLSYVCVLSVFSVLMIVSLFLVNYTQSFNFLTFIKPFIYFNFPYIFILSSIILIFDVFIGHRLLKILSFIFSVFFIASPLIGPNLDLIGVNEFVEVVKDKFNQMQELQNEDYSIGYVHKAKNLTYLKIEQINWWTGINMYRRIALLPLSAFIIFLFSFIFKRYSIKGKTLKQSKKKKSLSPAKKYHKQFQLESALYFKSLPIINNSFVSLLSSYFVIFKTSFSKFQLTSMVILWIASFFIGPTIASKIIISIVFLLGFNIYDKFINIDNIKSLVFSFDVSVYSTSGRLLSKSLILFTFFIICATPLFLFKTIDSSLMTVAYLLTLSILSTLLSYLLKGTKLLEIAYIILFASYFSGHPVLNIL